MAGERVERRLAAILAADVAGYSRLMGADEVGTLAALKAIRREVVDPALSEHKGRIFKTTGDGLLVEFASAVDAVTCAMTVQAFMAKRDQPAIKFRIGINIGDIIIDRDDIFGDGVNVAARIENECDPGAVCLSGSAFEQVRGKTNFAFDDLGERSLKNIERAVRLYRVREAPTPPATATAQAEAWKSLALPDRPSIAVLPFQNMSGDPEQEYFADGMVEDIITALSRFKSLFVIARNSSFTYKGKSADIKQVGRELGVRYVLEGSVRKAGGRVRITGQLIEAATGSHIWADRIDGAVEDVFDLQDEVTRYVVGAIEPSITHAEISRAKIKPTSNLDAYDLYLRALSAHYSLTLQDVDEAVRLLEQAIALDPSYSWAKAFAAYMHALRGIQGWATQGDYKRATALAREAMQSSRAEPNTLAYAAHALAWLTHEYDFSLAAMDRAIHLNPNSFNILMRSGWIRTWIADVDNAVDHFLRSIRLNPIDPSLGFAYGGLAFAYIIGGDYEKALEYGRRTAHEMPRWVTSWSAVAISAAFLGRQREAAEAIQRNLQLMPGSSLSARAKSRIFRDQWCDDRVLEGLRLAGLPEN